MRPHKAKAKIRLAKPNKDLKPLKNPEKTRNKSNIKLSKIVIDKRIIFLPPKPI